MQTTYLPEEGKNEGRRNFRTPAKSESEPGVKIIRMEIEGLLKGLIVWGYKHSLSNRQNWFLLFPGATSLSCLLRDSIEERRRESAIINQIQTVWTVPVEPISEK